MSRLAGLGGRAAGWIYVAGGGDPLYRHFDFGVAAKVVERKKGSYEKPVMGIHVPRQVPLEEYDPKKHGFAKGDRYTIKAKVDKEGRVTIYDPRVPGR